MSERATLDPRHADLWYVYPERVAAEPSLLESYRRLLTDDELRRMHRYVFERDRLTQLVARVLVRTTLSRYAPAVSPAEWVFATGDHGQPVLSAPAAAPTIRFNLTHTDGLVALLVSCEREVGLDAEDATRVGQHLDHPEHFFAPTELAGISQLEGPACQRRFYELWTLKEAYLKARGLGLALPLDRFALTIGDDPSAGLAIAFAPPIDDDPSRWQLWQQRLGERHQLAAVIDRGQAADDLAIDLREVVPRA